MSWSAYSHGDTTLVFRNGVRWGEVQVGTGFAVARPRHKVSIRFEGCAAIDQAWRSLLPHPLPSNLALDLQDEAEANRLEVCA